MKSSEAMLRAIAANSGKLGPAQVDEWLEQLLKAGLIKKGDQPFTYELTETAQNFLRKKGAIN
ncbi:hypothetical protein [Cytobacillus horneckiae]|uniref:hypothetical protein n=1 Tax=Cytobacillus horneckiae TaxID=549687 RepID=UPI003D9AAC83